MTMFIKVLLESDKLLFLRLQYGFNFYLQYLINHPEYFQVCEHPSGEIMGYGTFFSDLF